MQLLEHNTLKLASYAQRRRGWWVVRLLLHTSFSSLPPSHLLTLPTIQALDRGVCSLTMLLVFVQPLVPVLHQQLVLSKRCVDKAIDER